MLAFRMYDPHLLVVLTRGGLSWIFQKDGCLTSTIYRISTTSTTSSERHRHKRARRHRLNFGITVNNRKIGLNFPGIRNFFKALGWLFIFSLLARFL